MTSSYSLRHRLAGVSAACVAALTLSLQAAPFQFNNGDLILGVQAASGTGSTKNLFLNLGPGVNHRNNGDLGQLANIGASLTSVFGANWYERSDLYFGVIGNLNTTSPGSPTFTPPVDGDPSRTFYISRPTSAPGAAQLIAEATYVSSSLGSAGTKFSGLEQMLVGTVDVDGLEQQPDGTAILDQGLQSVQWNNGWSAWNPVPGAAFDVFTGGIQQSFGQGGDATYVDIQRILATNTGANPPGTAGGGTYVTTISISSAGVVSAFTPEPDQPELDVVQSDGSSLVTGTSVVSFGSVAFGQNGNPATFFIQSAGTGTLTVSSVTVLGDNAGDFILSGPSSLSFAPGDEGAFTLQFIPTALGVRTATLRIVSDDADENPFEIQLTGTGVVLAPEIEVEQPAGTPLVSGTGSQNLGSNVVVGSGGGNFTFTIRNTGTANLTGLAASMAGSHPGDFVVAGPSARSLAPTGNATITVRFQPQAVGNRSAVLRIASNDEDENPFDILLTGTGTVLAPEIAVEQPAGTSLVSGTGSQNLGTNVPVGSAGTDFTFTIRNTGTANLTGITLGKAGSHPGDFTVVEPGTITLAPSASTTFTVRFEPQSAGTRTADLAIASNDSDENPFSIRVTGTSVSVKLPPEIEITGADDGLIVNGKGTIKVGKEVVGETGKARVFTIKNSGATNLTGLKLSVSGKNSADFIASGLKVKSLSPGASTSFKVVFKPSAKGSRTAVVKLASNDTDENPFKIEFSGTGILSVPKIVVQQPKGKNLVDGKSKKNFGTVVVGKSKSMVFTIKNTGDAKLSDLKVSRSGKQSKEFTVTKLGVKSLAPGASATFKVIFKPTAKGPRNAALRIMSNDPGNKRFDIKITGLGAVR